MTDLDDAIAELRRKRGRGGRKPDGHLTVSELATRAQVSNDTVKKWLADGLFPNAIRSGPGPTCAWWIPESDIIAAAEKES